MAVAVISRTGKKLMPTNEYRARRLLKSGNQSFSGGYFRTLSGNPRPFNDRDESVFLLSVSIP